MSCLENRIDYAKQVEILKALAHPLRLRIVHGLLTEGCHNVRFMEGYTGESQSCISQHLQRLRSVGVVSAERVGNEMYYHVQSRQAADLITLLMDKEAERDAL